MTETIYALSSGTVPSGVAVIRVSGPGCDEISKALIGGVLPARLASLKTIRDRNGDVVDQGLVLNFPAPASFTGENCLEFQIHGGRATVHKLMRELAIFPDTRPAEAGEFTKRAFENAKIDLVEAEGLADLIGAETEMQRRLAAEHSSGGLSQIYGAWAKRLTHARAMIEAELDFADEDDVPGSVADAVWRDMESLWTEMQLHLEAAPVGEIIRDGLKVAIIGAPNAGKSSLINALVGRDIAIVTDIPGTTRDLLSCDLDINGYAIRLVDTAGIRESQEPIEQEGIRRARIAMGEADLILLVQDVTGNRDEPALPGTIPVLRIGSKADLGCNTQPIHHDLLVSVRDGRGLDALRAAMVATIEQRLTGVSLAIPSRIRHVSNLESASFWLRAACHAQESGLDLRAEHLRLAAHALGRITGQVDVDSLLDIIFSKFCIGK